MTSSHIPFLLFLTLLIPHLSLATTPVTVHEAVVRRTIKVGPLPETSYYPARADTPVTRQIAKEMEQAKQAFYAAYDKGDDGYTRWRALQQDPTYSRLKAAKKAEDEKLREHKPMEIPVITLENAYVRIQVVPTLGMRIANAIDLVHNQSLFGADEPGHHWDEEWTDLIGWTAGAVEVSFPYFEHGTGVLQSAGYRVIRHEDGAVTVAMNMRFTQHQHPRDMQRYGRYSSRIVSSWVTLKPDESRFTYTVRLDNPNPLRRSERIWTNYRMRADRYDDTHLIYPMGYVIPHGGGSVSPFQAENGRRRWIHVSHFGLYPDYGFMGTYDPERDTNSLITQDVSEAPGMKLYTTREKGGFLEFWNGTTTLFEDPGEFVNGFEPVTFTTTLYNATGIGRVDFANPEIALSVNEEDLRLISPTSGSLTLGEQTREVTAGQAVRFSLPPGPFRILRDGKVIAEVSFPLSHTDTRRHQSEVGKQGGKLRLEKEQISNHKGAPSSWWVVREAERVIKQEQFQDDELLISLANGLYRFGHFDTAKKLLKQVEAEAYAESKQFLRDLMALEAGANPDFADTGLDGGYFRALHALKSGQRDQALAELERLLKERPSLYRPKLLRAWLQKNTRDANALAKENPASPEALLVLELLGEDSAAEAKQALLRHNPGAKEEVAAFQRELMKGVWSPRRRFEPMLPEAE